MDTDSSFDKARHVKYWTRCLKTFLPHQYTSNDSNRMYLAYFIVAALDLLDVLDSISTEEERRGYVDWIYHCQHPKGGFRMWPGTDFGERANVSNAVWDPANVPATYFALASLIILRDDLQRVNRTRTLEWINKMQRPDGSFGETLVSNDIKGGHDPRFAYCATGVRHILNGPPCSSPDIDIPSLVRTVHISQSYNGGIADERYHEPHAGYTYCSLGALAFTGTPIVPTLDKPSLVSWLTSLQTAYTDPEGDPPAPTSADLDTSTAGFAGRENKPSDTCYAFWVSASLHLLGEPNLYDHPGVRQYLLDQVQHRVLGGFGKFPGDIPDLYHSYLGLAALSLVGHEGVKALDPGMCLSRDVRARLEGIWKAWEKT